MKIGTLGAALIAIVTVSVFVGVFSLYISNHEESYADTMIGYDATKFEKYQLDSQVSSLVKNTTKKIGLRRFDLSTPSQILDIMGGFFRSGWNGLKLIFNTQGYMITLSEESIGSLPLGQAKTIFLSAIATIVAIILLYLILSILLRWQV